MKDDWGKINQDMIGLTKIDYGIDRLKGKWNRLCKVHHLFVELVGQDPQYSSSNVLKESK